MYYKTLSGNSFLAPAVPDGQGKPCPYSSNELFDKLKFGGFDRLKRRVRKDTALILFAQVGFFHLIVIHQGFGVAGESDGASLQHVGTV